MDGLRVEVGCRDAPNLKNYQLTMTTHFAMSGRHYMEHDKGVKYGWTYERRMESVV